MKDVLNDSLGHNVTFWVCLIVSVILILGGALVPPPFVIDNSIFIAVGELFGFASLGVAARAIEKGVDTKIKKGNTEVTFGDLNKDEN